MTQKKECVVLLHGLSRTKYSLAKLANDLRNDYDVINETYPSRSHTVEALAKLAVGGALDACDSGLGYEKIHFVTHSMGGILVRQYLSQHSIENMGNVVMLGPPNKGSELVDFFQSSPFLSAAFNVINGPAGGQLGTGQKSWLTQLGAVDFALGVIAGTRNYNIFYRRILNDQSDGKVTVESSKVEGMADHLILPVDHTFMMLDRRVIEQVRHFLAFAEFKH